MIKKKQLYLSCLVVPTEQFSNQNNICSDVFIADLKLLARLTG